MSKNINIDAIAKDVVKKMVTNLNKTDDLGAQLTETIIDISADVTASILKAYHEAISSKQ
ncbi:MULTISPECIES: hypothetical protein [Fusobacterium]|jgi:hypothetical protein|uniref:hypothetical protein n=1 Tax=Fusobacterium TaxID=848 RepID=UPI0008A247A6|nr:MULTISPECIES: hypothetical protein [Fusobacterium]MCI6034250.1 hypothetical protein [Fusobacterium varium]OFL92948.1 hypothetical protein HMPREF2747_06635 [Fusobacterium sp. HMSC073F01]DAK06663.1 MAG TPA: hypothetical protein [Caudoviricetes sp.]